MAIQLERFSIRNYKSIPPEGVELEFQSHLIALVGKNNAGKSNIFEAINLLLGTKNPRYVGVEEPCFHDPLKPIVIEGQWRADSFGDGKALGLSDGQCHALIPKPRKNEQEQTDRGRVVLRLRVPPTESIEDSTGDSNAEPDLDREEDTKREVVLEVGRGTEIRRVEPIRQKLARLITVPPVRSHADLLSPSAWTSFGRLLRDLLAGTPEASELERLIAEATTKLQEVLRNESIELTRTAKTTAFVDSIDFQFTKEGEAAELLRNLTLAVTYAGRTDLIDAVGTGTQSAVILGVLELCLRHGHVAGSRLFAVEEPELFLHPQAQRRAGDLLRKLAASPGHYVLLTTHSGHVLSSCDVFDVARIDRNANGGTTARRLSRSFGDIDRTTRVLTASNGEMLFADRVILVEGPSEAVLLPRLARIIADPQGSSCDLDARNVSVVSVEGKNQFAAFTRLLEAFGIDWRILCDFDALSGSTLSPFRAHAGLSGSEPRDEQIHRLRGVGVAVLRRGEIEDYYPHETLAALAQSSVDEIRAGIEEGRQSAMTPSGPAVLAHVIRTRRDEIVKAPDERVEKISAALWSQSTGELRDGGEGTVKRRKTGDILVGLLGLPKPAIASRVASWFEEDPGRLTDQLTKLVQWIVAPTRSVNPFTESS